MNSIILKNLSEDSRGSIKPNDRLVMIDNDEVSTWTVARGDKWIQYL